jgi:hypothetical protein
MKKLSNNLPEFRRIGVNMEEKCNLPLINNFRGRGKNKKMY